MLKNNKGKAIISSIIILLPILAGLILWGRLPDTMAVHWGVGGAADGIGSKAFTVFGLPAILLVLHLICLLIAFSDKRQNEQNKKAVDIIFAVFPFISLLSNGIIYSAALGKEFNLFVLVPVVLGAMFIFIGNYLPKVKQNQTLGIKLPWTLADEENWNKTHRFGGKIWVIGGLILLLSVVLPNSVIISVTVAVSVCSVAATAIYSYCLYRKKLKEGAVTKSGTDSKTNSAVTITAVILTLILCLALIPGFTGDINIRCGESAFTVEASYYSDLEIQYSEIDSIEYRDSVETGARTNGFGSSRLLMGSFSNDEFGAYTRYTYNENNGYIVMSIGGKILVIGGKDIANTKEIYETISAEVSP